MFNTKAKPKEQPEETIKEELSVEESDGMGTRKAPTKQERGKERRKEREEINIAKMGDRRGLDLSRRKRCAGDGTRTHVENRPRGC